MSNITRRFVISGAAFASIASISSILIGCSTQVETKSDNGVQETSSIEDSEATDNSEKEPSTPEEADPEPIEAGDSIATDKWNIILTDAYVSYTLESDKSRTSWTADNGVFAILEFDIESLTSDKIPVDQAIKNNQLLYNGNTYSNFDMKYLAGELWLSAKRTYFDANIPVHIYVYTTLPATATDDDKQIAVTTTILDQNRIITLK